MNINCILLQDEKGKIIIYASIIYRMLDAYTDKSHLDATWVSQSLYSGPLSNPDFFLSLIAGRIRQVVLYKEMIIWWHDAGHMTKMAARPIYGKNLWKSSSQEPDVLWSWNLACSIGDSSSTKFI